MHIHVYKFVIIPQIDILIILAPYMHLINGHFKIEIN